MMIREKSDVPLESFGRLLHPYGSVLVTAESKGKKNVMAVAWIMPVSINPPILATSIRATRYTFKLINESKCFAVNIPSFSQAKEVLMCGRKSGKETDKFKQASFTVEKGRATDAPIIKECVAHIECRVGSISRVGDHMLITGEVCAAYASNEIFDEMYKLEIHRPLLHLGGDLFTTTQRESIKP
jgi:flavin reductase (DIM6/NTAB) family NADH-FMN oxidoreductase RutF